ncbi:helix-turn-helix domain-containing protein [Sphingobacterium sp. CZ-2]|nr:AraC family transcriptional regulator [Sphingobacterium sp. CZ-2]
MKDMQLAIKNMVCPRCVMAVEQILNNLNIPFQDVKIGLVNLQRELSDKETDQLDTALGAIGFEVLQDRKERLLEEIKIALQEFLGKSEDQHLKTSVFLTDRFNLEYTYISSLFSELAGESIEKYLIKLKIEKVKEFLQYDMSLSEIATKLNYSSVAHLSSQFKKVTGMTPSEYKKAV